MPEQARGRRRAGSGRSKTLTLSCSTRGISTDATHSQAPLGTKLTGSLMYSFCSALARKAASISMGDSVPDPASEEASRARRSGATGACSSVCCIVGRRGVRGCDNVVMLARCWKSREHAKGGETEKHKDRRAPNRQARKHGAELAGHRVTRDANVGDYDAFSTTSSCCSNARRGTPLDWPCVSCHGSPWLASQAVSRAAQDVLQPRSKLYFKQVHHSTVTPCSSPIAFALIKCRNRASLPSRRCENRSLRNEANCSISNNAPIFPMLT